MILRAFRRPLQAPLHDDGKTELLSRIPPRANSGYDVSRPKEVMMCIRKLRK